MKTAKQELIELLERLPDTASMDTLAAEALFLASFRRSEEDVRRGNLVPHEEVRARLNKWLESSGQTKLSGT